VTRPPEFSDLFGDELPAEERARLERVHDLLVEAGPPPELPPSLAEAPHRGAEPPSWLPRRRLGAGLALAAAIALVAFLGGWVAGFSHKNNFNSTRQVSMQGTPAAPPGTSGLIKLGASDGGGNWPMEVTVRGLPRLTGQAYYELFLTRNGTPIAPCGGFNVQPGTTTVRFTVPYALSRYDGWVVTRQNPADSRLGPVLLKTSPV
jgi:hypothetical protein